MIGSICLVIFVLFPGSAVSYGGREAFFRAPFEFTELTLARAVANADGNQATTIETVAEVRRKLQAAERTLGRNDAQLLPLLIDLAELTSAQGNSPEPYLLRALDVVEEAYGSHDSRAIQPLVQLAAFYFNIYAFGAAERTANQAIGIVQGESPYRDQESWLRTNLALAFLDQARWNNAEQQLLEVLALTNQTEAPSAVHLFNVGYLLGGALYAQGKADDLRRLIRQMMPVASAVEQMPALFSESMSAARELPFLALPGGAALPSRLEPTLDFANFAIRVADYDGARAYYTNLLAAIPMTGLTSQFRRAEVLQRYIYMLANLGFKEEAESLNRDRENVLERAKRFPLK
jgi:hypothetical protein